MLRHRRLWPVIQWIERAGSGVWNDEEKETGKSSSGGGDPDAPSIVPDHRCERGRAERTVVCDCKAGRFSAGNRSDFAQEKRIRVPDGVRERGRSLHTARLRKAEKRRLFHTDRRSIEIGKRRFRADKTRRTCRKGGAERRRLLPLRRAENESGGGTLSRI